VTWESGNRFLDSTRGQVVSRLRCADQTVEDLAASLGLTPNAIRLHLQRLEIDGMVTVVRTRRPDGAGKPAQVYGLAPGAEQRFSRAYAPVLGALLDVLAERMDPEAIEEVTREAGRRIAAAADGHGPANPALAARRILADLGGAVEVGSTAEGLVIRGCGCPLGAVTGGRPAVCQAMETLLSTALRRPVRESCDRSARPRCRFVVDLEVDGAA
jgi:predicted ArsR family transcriptional regulator